MNEDFLIRRRHPPGMSHTDAMMPGMSQRRPTVATPAVQAANALTARCCTRIGVAGWVSSPFQPAQETLPAVPRIGSAGVRDSAGRASSTTGLVRPTSSPAPLGGRTERAQAGAAPTGATGIVRDAISASGGLGEPWCLDGVTAVRVGNVLLEVDAWLRNAACPMAWRRVEPGLYRCGGYVVGQLDTGEWFADGPVVDRCFDHKRDAQAACAAARR